MLYNFRTYQLALALHQGCKALKLTGELGDQINRASLSVVLNLAEGSGKLTANDRRRFFAMALGSIREVQACLAVSSSSDLQGLADKVGAHTYKLIHKPGTLLRP